MSEIRTTKSLEALSASLNRALAGARAPQVAAARRAQMRQAAASPASGAAGEPHRRAHAVTDVLAARSRTNMLIGTLDRLRHPTAGRRAGRSKP
ncbi:conserved hypothetical protein [Frankia canadensis]|uniref:Uncharacterized protein n=1 Tax=Frankia canadensis TaxID=1836972 RepID=A0A2I2L0R5_9ACTN|nr:hypothetical protein [Frankia canadensis]SNQ51504.1 conserved hypothetical protein [Frankia canadensis]SOU58794.1 conserved hypothetical protein [Frankia canadensis]